MYPKLLSLINFYRNQLSTNVLLGRYINPVLLHCTFILFSYFTFFFLSNTWAIITSLILLLCALLSILYVVYQMEKESDHFITKRFNEKIYTCLTTIYKLNFLLSINNIESVRQKRMKKLLIFLKCEGVYDSKNIKRYLELLESEYQKSFSNSATSPATVLIPMTTTFIQVMLKPDIIKSSNEINIFFISTMLLLLLLLFHYMIFKFILSVFKNAASFMFPIPKNDMRELIIILQELHLYCTISEENQSDTNSNNFKDFINS